VSGDAKFGWAPLEQTAVHVDVLSMKSRYMWVVGLCVVLTGCSPGSFDFSMIQYMIEVSPIALDGEQIMVTEGQIECGVQSELWDRQQLGPNRAVARLNQPGRDLHFGDDVVMGEVGMHSPYVQVRGTFQLRMSDFGNVRADGEKFKLVDVRVGVEIPQTCFQSPLPQLMAVRRGRFTQDAMPTFRFRLEGNSWVFDRIQH
jgi:hypothetical protein